MKRTYVKRDVLEEQNRAQQDQIDPRSARNRCRAADRDRQGRGRAPRAGAAGPGKPPPARGRAEPQPPGRGEPARAGTARARGCRAREEPPHRRACEDRTAKVEPARVERPHAEVRPAPRAPDAPARGAATTTRYGRQELHVAGDMGRASRRRRRACAVGPLHADGEQKHGFEMPTAPMKREVQVGETITVAELAQRMAVKATEVIKTLMGLGVMATINQPIDQDTAVLVVEEMGHEAKLVKENEIEEDIQGAGRGHDPAAAASAGRHGHGPCRSRQDLAARLHPARQGGRGRSRRHHAAHRCVSRRDAARA